MKEQPELLEIGKAEVIQNFSNNGRRKVALFGLGNMNSLARKAAAQLAAEGFDCAVINPRFTKPIDAGTHEFFGTRGGRSGDDGRPCADGRLRFGGAGIVQRKANVTTPVVRIGWPDQFIEHASTQDELRRKYGLTVENTVAKVKAQFGEPADVTKLIEVA